MTPKVADWSGPSERLENSLRFRPSALCYPEKHELEDGRGANEAEMADSRRNPELSSKGSNNPARSLLVSQRTLGGVKTKKTRERGPSDEAEQPPGLSRVHTGDGFSFPQIENSSHASFLKDGKRHLKGRGQLNGEQAPLAKREPRGLYSKDSAVVGAREQSAGGKDPSFLLRGQVSHVSHTESEKPRWRKRVEVSADYRSSRLIVKNLPSYLNSAELVGHLSSLGGEVTDVCLLRNDKGRSRQCAFVGFKTQKQAADVKGYFNQTFLHTRKIEIEYALPRATAFERKPRAEATVRNKKRKTPGKEQEVERERNVKRVHKGRSGAATVIEEEVTNARKAGISGIRTRMFFEEEDSSGDEADCCPVMSGNRIAGDGAGDEHTGLASEIAGLPLTGEDDDLSWLRKQSELASTLATGAESVDVPGLGGNWSDPTTEKPGEGQRDEESDLALLGSHGRLLVQNLPFATTAEELRALCSQHGEVAEVHLVTDEESHKPKGFGFVTFVFPEHAVASLPRLNHSIFQGRVLHVVPARPDLRREQRLQLREEQLRQSRKRTAGSSFKAQQHQKRLELEQNKSTEDKVWNLLYVSANAAADAVLSQLRAEKGDLLLNGEDGKRGRAASGVGMGNTTAATVALMESHLLNQTKEWIKAEGISLGAFERRGATLLTAEYKSCSGAVGCRSEGAGKTQENESKEYVRSPDTLIVKHLPTAHVEAADLLRLFERIGPLARFLLAPSKTVAIVQFERERDAEVAFRKLSYRKYKNVPLFLEKAPVNVFTEREAEEAEAHAAAIEETKAARLAERAVQESGERSEEGEQRLTTTTEEKREHELNRAGRGDPNTSGAVGLCSKTKGAAESPKLGEVGTDADTAAEGDEDSGEGGPSLFVKNINFTTSEAVLNQVFVACPGLRHTRLMMKKRAVTKRGARPEAEKGDGGLLSMGYAFVEFDSLENAMAACKRMQGAVVDGHTLQISLSRSSKRNASGTGDSGSERAPSAGTSSARGTRGRKLLVRNLAFQASAADLRGLFSAYGTVTRVRIPTQHEGRSRGFGFVDFATKQEAQNAFQGLSGSHLYGRKLVLEFAKQESIVAKKEEA